jgi:predicted nucleic acid-binding protein
LIYLDTCALVKLVLTEQESAALWKHLAAQAHVGVISFSSELAQVEVRRTLIRRKEGHELHAHADAVLKAYAKLPIAPVLLAAGRLPYQHLGSLDALHLATAASLGKALTEFITYDQQLGKIAEKAGLPVLAPGT